MQDKDKIDGLIKATKKGASRLESLLYRLTLDFLIDNLDLKEGKVKYTAANESIVNKLIKYLPIKVEKTTSSLFKRLIKGLKSIFTDDTNEISKYDTRGVAVSKKVTDKVLNHASRSLNQKMDLVEIYAGIKKTIINEMSDYDGVSLKQIRKRLQGVIKDKKIVSKYYGRWTHDIYTQYKRIAADEVRKDVGLRFAVYTGGLIDTSRHFCEQRNNKVFHEDEIKAWSQLNWKEKPDTGYNPLYDCGGYNCRHYLVWVSDEYAYYLRPELKIMYGG